MKKINSIGYGHKIILSAAILLVIVPVICYLLIAITKKPQFLLYSKISFVSGLMILLLLFVLLQIEFFQDRKIDAYFEANRYMQLALRNGLYECQACGNNQVKREQKSCNICGANFRNWGEHNGNND